MHDTLRQTSELLYAATTWVAHAIARVLLVGLSLIIMVMWILVVVLLTGRLPYALRRYL